MNVYVIILELDHEGGVVQEVWEKKYQAEHRVSYLNKNKAGVSERYVMTKLKVRSKQCVKRSKSVEDKS